VLRRVATAEGIDAEEGAVALIARSASGSFRDALGTLDQMVAFGGEKVSLAEVIELLGAADAELLFEAVDAVAAEDPKGVLLSVERMSGSGRDPSQFARDLLDHLRHLLITQTVGKIPSTFVVTASDPDRLAAQAAAIGPAMLIRTIDELAQALSAVREGDDARLAVEIALLKASRPDLDPSSEGLLRRIERLEQRIGAPTSAAPQPTRREEEPETEEPDLTEGSEKPIEPEPEPVDLERIARLWPAVLDQLRQAGAPALAALFEGASPVEVDREGATLTVGFPTSATFNKRKAEAPEKRQQVAEALMAVTAERLRPLYVVLNAEAEQAAGVEEQIDEAELLERLKSEFDAEEVG
jgi:DNA polymerase-3 subunit gamma/tau